MDIGFISDAVQEIVQVKINMLNGEAAQSVKKASSPDDWRDEMQTITINAGRRMGHTTALHELSKKHPDMLIIVRNEALRRNLVKDMNTKCRVLHMAGVNERLAFEMMRGAEHSIIAIDDWSAVQADIDLEYIYACLPTIVLLLG